MFRNLRLSEKQRHVKVKVTYDTRLDSTRVTEILNPPYRVVREIQSVELRQTIEILNLLDEVVVQEQALEFPLVIQIGDLAYTVALQPQALQTRVLFEILDEGET